MKSVLFHPSAQEEMIDAATYYEARSEGLGRRFLAAVQDAVARIQAHPTSYRVVDSDVRRCLTRIFPYGVLFRVRGDDLITVAVMHLHRRPGYWRQRVREV